MKALWVFAHPEPRSLNGALHQVGLRWLEEHGHQVLVSDLYAMGWKAVANGSDLQDRDTHQPLRYGAESEQAYRLRTLSPDIRAEQAKLRWADTIIIQYPMWWFSVPAILKGWFDRVLTKGFAYGAADPQYQGRTMRYGKGRFKGKRAMLIVTAGGREPAFGARGVHGFIDHVLFPVQHGTLWYTGVSVMPPLVIYGAHRIDRETFTNMAGELRDRLDTLHTTAPIAFRLQNSDDYEDDLTLKPHVAPDASGFDAHLRR